MKQKLESVFMDFVIKLKYNMTDTGIDAVFIPYAIPRSFCFRNMWECFHNLFSGTPYYDEVKNYLDSLVENERDSRTINSYEDILDNKDKYGVDDNLYHGIFNAIISSISMYLMKLFSHKIKTITNIDIKYNKERFIESNNQAYAQSVYESVYGYEENGAIVDYAMKIASIKSNPVSQKISILGDNPIKATFENIEFAIRDMIIQNKKQRQLLLAEDMENKLLKELII